MILHDFFRCGFNGTGSNGGSCIDGRSTSAWNWCSKLHIHEVAYCRGSHLMSWVCGIVE